MIENYFSPKTNLREENLPTDKPLEHFKTQFTTTKGQVISSCLNQFSYQKGDVSIQIESTASHHGPITTKKFEIEIANEKQVMQAHENWKVFKIKPDLGGKT